jgi:hypothetical protein
MDGRTRNLLCSLPCRCSAQPSPGLRITTFLARSLPRSVPSPFSAPQPRGTGADMNKDYLTLKRASASRPSGEWSDDDYDVLAEGVVVGRIFHAAAAPVGSPWMWTLAYGFHEDRNPTHGTSRHARLR